MRTQSAKFSFQIVLKCNPGNAGRRGPRIIYRTDRTIRGSCSGARKQRRSRANIQQNIRLGSAGRTSHVDEE